jgi:hypothetical protein
MKMSI